MSKRSPIPYEIKIQVVRRCLQHESNPNYEAKQLGIHKSTVTEWIRKYQAGGVEGLKKSKGWKAYSKELRLAAIQDALSGEHSVRSVVKKYHISSKSVLESWISKYTEGAKMKPTPKRMGSPHMNKGRKTTYEERIEIAQFTIAHDLDYQKAIDKYDVSYQQVYTWVRKYQTNGHEGLKDLRGRKKPLEELDEQERLKLRIKELEARNEYLEMENALAKKLAEIRRRNTH
ncbi:helix-turn-helix domain-containing protein [Paenibacillus polygoni]|uniref:Helix-turn-helix domain-containing protein n=1 Tax=Paenibacillus polygoni TaxID=3050112 RepID=A0ABY8X2X8_9BACL|nr:helix-turn-helix domain-containing protein [Paenibacillus polygoni]WIV17575.1 helix-turn-helix domain-containing protein [Paenibacillus polygoni]